MAGAAEQLDRELTLALNGLNSPFSDVVWQIFSFRPLTFVIGGLIIVFLFIRLGWKKALIVLVCTLLCIGACDQLGNLVKEAVARLRPVHDPWMMEHGLHVLEEPGKLYGFFSAHAANAMGIAVCSKWGFMNDKTHSYRAYGAIMVLWALLVGISRVFVGKHFLGDVLAGWLVGLIFGLIFGLLSQFLIKKLVK
ncbi:MAG: phosphatase PAP2 family protein [Bacteroidales bacterium]|nr:phosphatase PAP2 family protein [Bacteroidales bacterium]